MKRLGIYLLAGSAYIAGTCLTITSAWLITMAANQPPLLTLSVAIVGVRFFGIARSVARYAERLASHKEVFDRLTSLRVRLYTKMISNPIGLIRDLGSGNLVKKVVDDVERAQEYELRITLPHGAAIISLFFGVLLGAWILPESLFAMLPIALLLLLYIPLVVKSACERSSKEIETAESKYAALIQQAAHGAAEAQLYGYLEERITQTSQLEEQIWRKERSLLHVNQRFQFLLIALIGTTLISLTFMALHFSNRLADVQVTMLIFLPLVIFEAVGAWYPNLFSAGKMLLARHEIAEIESTPVPSHNPNSELTSPVSKIIFRDVRVAWNENVHFMQPVSFAAELGESISVRGRSGSGKTTLAMAALGLLEYEGSILLNDIELRDVKDLHRYLAGTVQTGHIFNTSLRENLKIAGKDISDEDILKALKIVELDNLVNEMPEGLDTVLGALGRPLSGGEAKRLGVARAILSEAQILLLDEPTEHLDDALASRIEKRILDLPRILIVVTHEGWRACTKTILLER